VVEQARRRTEVAASMVVVVIGSLALIAALGVVLPVAGVVAATVLGLAAVLVAARSEPVALAVWSMPLLLSVQRLGGEDASLSMSDALLFVLFWVVALLGPRPLSPVLRSLMWLTVVYQAATILTVLVNPYPSNLIEWFHTWLLTAAAILVGWAAGVRGYATKALTLLILTTAAISVLTLAAVAQMVAQGGLGAVVEVYLDWPWAMHKNVIGTLLAFTAIVVYARPPWLHWPRWATTPMFWLLSAGMAASQSRQAIISVVVAVVLIALRQSSMARRSKAIVVPVFAAMVGVMLMVVAQFSEANAFNSVYQRMDWYAQSTDVWLMNPWFGMGNRWWYTGLLNEEFQPPQAILEVLSTTGIFGMIGFVIMLGGFMVVLWYRLPPEYGTLAVAVVLARVVQGQLDQFWVTVQVSMPLLIAGICVGAYDWAARSARPSDASPDEQPETAPSSQPALVTR